jgi:hypothetical protein
MCNREAGKGFDFDEEAACQAAAGRGPAPHLKLALTDTQIM